MVFITYCLSLIANVAMSIYRYLEHIIMFVQCPEIRGLYAAPSAFKTYLSTNRCQSFKLKILIKSQVKLLFCNKLDFFSDKKILTGVTNVIAYYCKITKIYLFFIKFYRIGFKLLFWRKTLRAFELI